MINYSTSKEEFQKLIAKLCKTLGNYKRAQFILYLGQNPNSSFTNLLFDTSVGPMNPASLKFHMGILMNSNIVERKQRGHYSLTEAGMASCEVLEYLSKAISYQKMTKYKGRE